MKYTKKIVGLLSALCLTVLFTACGDSDNATEPVEKSSAEEINAAYEAKMSEVESDGYETLPDTNPIIEEFTQTDFQFTAEVLASGSDAAESAFNVPKNGYAIMTPSGASFGYMGTEAVALDGAYKNCKGFGFSNTVADILASYKISDADICETESGSVAFGFSSDDGVEFSKLPSDSASRAYSARVSNQNAATNAGCHTLALLVITADGNGMLSQYEIYHYSTEEEQAKHDH